MFLLWIVHWGIWNRCIVGFVRLVYWLISTKFIDAYIHHQGHNVLTLCGLLSLWGSQETTQLFNSLCDMVSWIFVSFVSGNGLLPDRGQMSPSTNTNLVSTGPLETNCSDILIEIQVFSFKKIHSKMWCAKHAPFYPCLNIYMRHKPSALAVGIISPLC